ncbi:MAG: low molecular weight protein-tyrosine-phosphatase [Candidatus Limivicinus sp.]|jgi:protein-tyrosine phosphatase
MKKGKTKILFICHGNICRSPTAEFIMKKLVQDGGLEDRFEIASAATSTEEIGSGVYPPARELLEARGIDCSGKRARQMTKADYEYYDLIVSMDRENKYYLERFYSGDPQGKLRNLSDYAGRKGAEIADPWYTRNFDLALKEIEEGCRAMLRSLTDSPI